jgi:hypothetical protein
MEECSDCVDLDKHSKEFGIDRVVERAHFYDDGFEGCS